jgi:hypothetical protein
MIEENMAKPLGWCGACAQFPMDNSKCPIITSGIGAAMIG